jgi:CHASE2 domain-containing sensor protein
MRRVAEIVGGVVMVICGLVVCAEAVRTHPARGSDAVRIVAASLSLLTVVLFLIYRVGWIDAMVPSALLLFAASALWRVGYTVVQRG